MRVRACARACVRVCGCGHVRMCVSACVRVKCGLHYSERSRLLAGWRHRHNNTAGLTIMVDYIIQHNIIYLTHDNTSAMRFLRTSSKPLKTVY